MTPLADKDDRRRSDRWGTGMWPHHKLVVVGALALLVWNAVGTVERRERIAMAERLATVGIDGGMPAIRRVLAQYRSTDGRVSEAEITEAWIEYEALRGVARAIAASADVPACNDCGLPTNYAIGSYWLAPDDLWVTVVGDDTHVVGDVLERQLELRRDLLGSHHAIVGGQDVDDPRAQNVGFSSRNDLPIDLDDGFLRGGLSTHSPQLARRGSRS